MSDDKQEVNLEAQAFASAEYPRGCLCAPKDEPCDWCKAVQDWYDNDEAWRSEWRARA